MFRPGGQHSWAWINNRPKLWSLHQLTALRVTWPGSPLVRLEAAFRITAVNTGLRPRDLRVELGLTFAELGRSRN